MRKQSLSACVQETRSLLSFLRKHEAKMKPKQNSYLEEVLNLRNLLGLFCS